MNTGVRIGEAHAIQWDDINWSTGAIDINATRIQIYGQGYRNQSPKTQSSNRTVYINNDLLKDLKSYKKSQDKYKAMMGAQWNPENLVFINSHGNTPDPYHLNNKLRDIFKERNEEEIKLAQEESRQPELFYEGYTLHSLRHTFASILYDRGVDLKSISVTMGHSSTRVTDETYTHIFKESIEKKIKKVIIDL